MVQHFRCKQASCKCHKLHAPGKQTGHSKHVRMCTFDTYSNRHVLVYLLLCAAVIALLCCAVLCCAHGSTTTYILVHTTAVLLLLYTCTAIPPVTLAHKEAWIGMTDICSKYKGASRRAALAARRFARRLHAM